jgi:predicted NBD/HSP70 family sugar kinase/biotin operon repressor
VSITANEPQRPSLEMLRQLTDRRVFEQLLDAATLTRSEIASRTGISKPTISESVRRLIEAGLVVESGRQVGGRGRAGTYCRLRAEAAAALAISIGPDGVVVGTFDLKDRPIAHVEEAVPVPADGSDLEPILLGAVQAALRETASPLRSCAVSLAGPVNRQTGQLIPVPHPPFLIGEFAAREILARVVSPPIEVDNDVNWAALAERQHGKATDLDDFVLCYFGPGIGAAVMVAGSIVGGRRGMAGELAHVRTVGAASRSLSLFECFSDWNLLKPGSEAIDVQRVLAILDGGTAADRRKRDQIAAAVAGAIDSVIALLDPQGVLVGGPWGSAPGFLDLIADRLQPQDKAALVLRPAGLREAPYRDGVRIRAVAAARQAVADEF